MSFSSGSESRDGIRRADLLRKRVVQQEDANETEGKGIQNYCRTSHAVLGIPVDLDNCYNERTRSMARSE